jgi:pimeloyl-ACP methyl ester carboxylesterase
MHQIVFELHLLLEKAGERAPFILVGHSYGGALVRTYQSTYAPDVAGLVLIDAVSDNPWRIAPDGKLVRSAELATGRAVPAAKMSEPLRDSDIPERIVKLIEGQSVQASIHANDPPRDKLPGDARRMRTWTLAQVKHGASNDNPVEPEEYVMLRSARVGAVHVLGDLPLIVLSRGVPEDDPRSEADHATDQATLVTLSRRGRQVIATRSGHHIPLDEPELVITAIRDLITARPSRDRSP